MPLMRKMFIAALFCFALVLMAGCGSEADLSALYGDDAKIAKSADSSFADLSVYGGSDGELSMYAQGFTGTKTLWRYTAEKDGDVTFSYSLSVDKGAKAKLVLISPDGGVTVLLENTDNAVAGEIQSQTISVKKGKNRIKIVGYEETGIDLVLRADVGRLGDE